jgi:zinc transport system substrate-binding protein
MKKTLSFILAVILLISVTSVTFSSCSGEGLYRDGKGELQVLCSIFPLFDVAREIGGERVTVSLLQDSGADLHNYTPTSATLDALANADVFICIGGVSDEKWLHDAIDASGNPSLKVIYALDLIEGIHAELENDWSEHDHGHETDHSGEHDHDGHDHTADEHVWTSLKNVKLISREICRTFSVSDPSGADYYADQAEKFISALDDLDTRYEELTASGVKPLVFADRFPFVYLFHDYHIPYVAAFSGCSAEVNASFETQIRLIRSVTDGDLAYVLTCEGGAKALADSVSNETGCAVLVLDSMQSVNRADIEAGETYLKIMEKNLEVLREVLS